MNTAPASAATRPHAGQDRGHRPITLHYVPDLAVRQGRRSIALCGQPVTCDQQATSRGLTGGEGVICPMCDLELERLACRYRDPDEPVWPLAVSLGLQSLMEDQAGLTVCELADRTGLDARRLHRELMSGQVPVDHMQRIVQACGTGMDGMLEWVDAAEKAIRITRKEQTND